MCVCLYVHSCACMAVRGQLAESWFSPTVWVTSIELRLSGLTEQTFTPPPLKYIFLKGQVIDCLNSASGLYKR